MQEVEKYQKVWELNDYRGLAPGEYATDEFVRLTKPKPSDTITDYGCGTGRAALRLSAYAKVRMLDFTNNSLDPLVRDSLGDNLTFEQHDLTLPVQGFSRFGFCCDVMEHIAQHNVLTVLRNIVTSARHCYFEISCQEDNLGYLIGETLHLTVQPYSWWLEQFNALNCIIHWSADAGGGCAFFVSAWASSKEIKEVCGVNTEDEVIREQTKINIQRGLNEARPYEQQDTELIILAGGPSINDYIDEIKINKRLGIPIVTLNGAYNWALEHGIKPDVQIVLDARELNKRFVEPVIPSCQYFIASQCHPSLFDSLPPEQVLLWHSGADVARSVVEELGIERDIYPTYGGMTIPLRAIPLLLMLGFHRFCIYGFDSCITHDRHHGYAQPENDGQTVVEVTCNGDKTFKCNGWHITQCHEWLELQAMIGDLCDIDIKGDGLIAETVKQGYKLALNDVN